MAASRGMDVTMINNNQVPFTAQLGADMGATIAKLHTANGVDLVCGAGIEDFDTADSEVTGVRLTNGRRVSANVVLVGIGAEPNVEWLEGSGLQLQDGVLCDSMGRTNVKGIVAVGDCAAWFEEKLGRHRRVEHWTGALERAALAVQALLDHEAPQQPLKPPYFWSDQHGVKIQFAGHSANYDRLEIETGDPQEHSFVAVYYQGGVPVAVLGMNQPRLFTKWRRSIGTPVANPAPARLVSAVAS